MAHPLEERAEELMERQTRREEWLDRKDSRQPSRRALAGGAVAAAATAAIHLKTPGGLAGGAAQIAKRTGAARRAMGEAMQRTGGRKAFTGPLQFRGLSGRQYAQDIADFATRTAPELKSRAHKLKSEFAQQYKKEMSAGRELDIGQRAREINEITENAAMRYRADRARPRIEEELDQIAQRGEESRRAVERLRSQIQHNIDDFTVKYGEQARTDRLIQAGLEEESAQEISQRLGTIRQEVMEETADMEFEQLENRLRDIMVEQQARRRTDTTEMGIGPRAFKEGREMIESALGYRKATAADIQPGSDFDVPDHLDVHERAKNLIGEIQDRGFDPGDIRVDPDLLVHEETGQMVDAGLIRQELGALRGQFAEGLLGSVTFQRDQMLAKKFRRKAGHELKAGYHQPVMADTPVVGDDMRLQETVYGVGDTAYRVREEGGEFGVQAVEGATGLEFTSGRFGAANRLLRVMSGVDAPDYQREGAPAWEKALGEKLDVSAQARPGGFSKTKSIFTKKRDPQWMQNKFQQALSDAQAGDLSRGQAAELHRYVKEQAPAMPEDVLYRLGDDIGYEGTLDLSSREKMVQTYADLFEYRGLDETGVGREAIESRARDMLERTRTISNRRVMSGARLQEGDEILQKQISSMMVQEAGPQNARRTAQEMLQQGDIIADQYKQTHRAITEGVIDRGFRQSTIENVGPVSQALQSEAQNVQRMLDETHPRGLMGKGPVGFESEWRADTLALSQFNLGPQNIADTLFAGRGNMENVHRGTLYAFNIPNRLNQLMRNVDVMPLQMTDESMTSPIGAMGNFMARRVLPLYAGKQAFDYVDDHAKDYTGYTLSQRFQRAQAHTRFTVAGAKEQIGLDSLMEQLDYATPGSEGVEEFMLHTPITGATFPMAAAGRAARFTGAFSTRDREEWQEYYEHGMEPVRRGQHWLLGMQPWMGDGITHHEPNPYKDAMSEWEYTDTVYGDRETYWDHRPFPTPRSPMAPIRRFVTDRYWWEEMHEERRPYPVSGPMFDPDTAWGSLLNPTIGRALKPQREYTEGADRDEIDDFVPPTIPFGRYTRSDLHVQEMTPDYMMSERSTAVMQMPGWTGEARAEDAIAAQPVRRDSHRIRTERIEGETVFVNEISGRIITPEDMGGEGEAVNLPLGAETNAGVPTAEGMPAEAMGDMRGDIRYTEEEMTRGPMNIPGEEAVTVGDAEHDARLLTRDDEYAMDDVRALSQAVSAADYNQGVQEVQGNINEMGAVIEGGRDFEEETPMDVRHPGSLEYQADRIRYIWGLRMPGIRGYLANVAFFGGDDFGEGQATLADASQAYGTSARFYRSGVGGRGGPFSEVFRRFFQRTPGLEERVNTLPNTMPNWMPEEYQTGDPYAEMPGGEYRLPGEAYESMNQLFPDRFGQYGAVDRAAILADVAPWSDEFDYWLTIAQNQDLPEDAEDKLQRALERSQEQQGSYHFTEYEYQMNNVETETVTVDQFIDQDRFTVNELDRPLRIAGVHGTFDTETEEGQAMVDVLSDYMASGQEITIRYEDREDPEATSPAVIYSRGQNINNMLKEHGVTPHEEQGDIEPYMYAHPYARAMGGLWERMVRTNVPILRTRITNVYSAYEHYRENNLYGMQFQNWQEPYEQVVKPNFQAFAARNPAGAAMGGAGTGAIAGLLLFGRSGAKAGAFAGAGIATGGSMWRMAHEYRTGEAWIPERRQEQRSIEEYYDRLRYLKNRRLYEKYATLAEEEEDVDLEAMIEEMAEVEREVDELQNRVDDLTTDIQEDRMYEGTAYKKMISSDGRIEYRPVTDRAVMQEIREQEGMDEIRELEEKDLITNLGPYARKALKFRQEKRSTMYGLDEDATVTEVMQALPQSEREYFPEFLEVEDEEQREEILRVVPDDMARALNMMWGQEYEEPEPIEEFFEDHYLPDEDWVGWREQVDLEHAQIKTVENAGKDPKDFGIWREYTKAEKMTPTPYTPWEGEAHDNPNPDVQSIRNQLEIILKEYDIENAEVEVRPKKQAGIDVNVDIIEDLRPQAESEMENILTA